MKGLEGHEGGIAVGPVAVDTHALHVQMNPALGSFFTVVTEDDGEVQLKQPPKSKQELAAELGWLYKIFFVRVDTPR